MLRHGYSHPLQPAELALLPGHRPGRLAPEQDGLPLLHGGGPGPTCELHHHPYQRCAVLQRHGVDAAAGRPGELQRPHHWVLRLRGARGGRPAGLGAVPVHGVRDWDVVGASPVRLRSLRRGAD